MATLPSSSLTPGQVAQSLVGSSPTQPIDANAEAALVTGNTGLTPATINALLGYQNDVTAAQTDVTAANAQGATDQLAATQAGYQATEYGYQADQAYYQGDVAAIQGEQDQLQSGVYGLQAQQAQDESNVYGLRSQADLQSSAGYGLQAEGYGQEQDAYNTAAGISAENAALAIASGNVQKAQEQRQIFKTLGSQRAQIAGAGFSGDSGTALALYADSARQGNLQLAQTDLQTNINAGSYLEASQAAKAEATAVGVAQTGALTAQQTEQTAAQEDTQAQQSAQLGVTEQQAAQQSSDLAVQRDTVAAQAAKSAVALDYTAQQGALAAENTYNVAASTDATAAATAQQTAATAGVNQTNLVNQIANYGVGTTDGGGASTTPTAMPTVPNAPGSGVGGSGTGSGPYTLGAIPTFG